MRRILAMLVLSSSLVPRLASAEPIFVTHTFDDRAAGVQGYFVNNLFLSSLAPTFTTNSIEIAASPLAVSAPNLVRPWSPGAVLEGRFLLNEAPHITLATGLLFFEVTGLRPSANPYTIQLFGRDGTLLNSYSGTIPQGWGFVRRQGPMISLLPLHSRRSRPRPGRRALHRAGRAGADDDDPGGDRTRGGVPAEASQEVAVQRRRIRRSQNSPGRRCWTHRDHIVVSL